MLPGRRVEAAESSPHHHTFACHESYRLTCDEEHAHTEACYTGEGPLVCGLKEGADHIHNEGDYGCEFVTGVLVCELQEHIHDDSCFISPEESEDGFDEVEPTAENLSGEEPGEMSFSISIPNEESSGVESPSEEPSSEQDPAKEGPNEEALTEGASRGELVADRESTEESLTEGKPVEGTPAKETPTEEIPVVEGSGGEEANGEPALENIPEAGSNEESTEGVDSGSLVDAGEEAGPSEKVPKCGLQEHQHGDGCYLAIYACRAKARSVDAAVTFVPKVKVHDVAAPHDEYFTFNIECENQNEAIVMPSVQVVTAQGAGEVSFEPIGFNAPGTYTFKISQETGGNSSYRYDDRQWTLAVTVVDDGEEMAAFGVYSRGETTSEDYASFINTYAGGSGWSASIRRQAQRIMDGMTLEEKVGQMFLVHYSSDWKNVSDTYNVGGFILFDADTQNDTPTSLRSKLDNAQANAKIPLLISVDEEGGRASSGRRILRVSNHSQYRDAPFLSSQELYVEGGFPRIAQEETEKAELLKGLGFNVNHAPVADVSAPGGYIYGRTFGGSGVENAQFVETAVKAYNNVGIGSTLKHFPGYGGTSSNTHDGFAVNELSLEDLMYSDLLPFRAGIAAGCRSIMVTHNTYTKIDPNNPASLSPEIYSLLRDEMNFDGVAITDDLNMKAVTDFVGGGQESLRALKAGADIALCVNANEQVPVVINAVKSGEFPLSRVEESCLRVLSWKIELGLIEEVDDTPAQEFIDEVAKLDGMEVTLGNLDEVVALIVKLETSYETLSASLKADAGVADAYSKLQAAKKAAEELRASIAGLSDAAIEFISTVNTTDVPEGDLVMGEWRALYDAVVSARNAKDQMTDEDQKSDLVKRALEKYWELAGVEYGYYHTQGLYYDCKDLEQLLPQNEDELPILSDAVMKAYEKTKEHTDGIYYFNRTDKHGYPIIKKVVAQYESLRDKIESVLSLSDAARKYFEFVNDLSFTGNISDSVLESLKVKVPAAKELYASVPEEERDNKWVKKANEFIERYEKIINDEDNLTEKARTFVFRVDGITYLLPFSVASFNQFKADVAAADALYSVLSAEERSLLAVFSAARTLSGYRKIVDDETILTVEAASFIEAVNEIGSDGNGADKKIAAALALYEALDEDSRTRVFVADAKTRLDNIRQSMEALSAEARAFVAAIGAVVIPDPVTNEFLNTLITKIPELQEQYRTLTLEDKETVSVQQAAEKLIYLANLLADRGVTHYDVQYYAYLPRLVAGAGDTLDFIDTTGGNLPYNGNKNLPVQRISINRDGSFVTEEKLMRVYTNSTFDLVDGCDISHFDKLSQNFGYTLSEIWVLKDGCSETSTNPDDWAIYQNCDGFGTDNFSQDAKNLKIRLVYSQNYDTEIAPVSFYDYDITDGALYAADDKIVELRPRMVAPTAEKAFIRDVENTAYLNSLGFFDHKIYVNSRASGINSEENYSRDGVRFAFGNANTGTAWKDLEWEGNTLNKANTASFNNCTFGLADRLVDGKIQYSYGVSAPNLFNDGDAIGKTPYTNGEFELGFDKNGDTYTLAAVRKRGTPVLTGLNKLRFTGLTSWSTKQKIWTNDFWPMDYTESFGGVGNDIKFGSPDTAYKVYSTSSKYTGFPTSDDRKLHNSYFGMNFSVEFSVTADYVGPLEYYFFGDDDLWVFLDGQLVCDIGGTHASVGEIVDLWDYIDQGTAGNHTLSIFYTERGASGSTCFMQYTLPNSRVIETGSSVESFSYRPQVSKSINGHDNKDDFRFSIKATGNTSGVTMPDYTTCHVVGAGTAEFGAITFTKPGTYRFEISEINSGLPDYIYDESVWTLTVTVVNIGGVLQPQIIKYQNEDGSLSNAKRAEFVNKYSIEPVMYVPLVTKELIGAYDGEEAFEFSITPVDSFENVRCPERLTATIHGSGEVNFGEFEFSAEGTYQFEIREIAQISNYYEFDSRVWTLTVTVTKANGKLTASGVYTSGIDANTASAVFVNHVKNQPELPSTGGPGVHLVYAISVSFLLMGVILETSKKKRA